jgi:omega-hydroxy-beta-dihydromenaquinone-9 sulfotransferase
MLYPSLVLQRMLAPLMPLLEKLSPARFHSTEAHHTSLTSVETDDVAVLFRHLDGFFLYGFFLSFDDEDMLPAVDPRVRDTSERDFAWLDKLWRRSLILHGTQRNVAKLFSLAVRLPRFLQRFPDAQILYMVRDPLEVIPSSMSLVAGVLERAFGFWSLPEAVRQRWLDRMYIAWIMLFRRFHEDWESGAIDRRRVFVVRYDRMMLEFEAVMEEMCTFLDHEMTPELRATVAKRADKQRRYESEHRYDLAKFGLSEEQIRRDCAFYYEAFLPPLARAPLTAARDNAE